MSIEEQLVQDFSKLPEEMKREVIDFVEFLNNKSNKHVEGIMDEVIKENHEALKELSK